MNKSNNINKTHILKIFKIQLKQFISEVIDWFPNEDDIKSLNTIVLTFCKYNPLKLIEIWNYYVALPYLDMINKGDFNYFENKNYSDDLKDLKGNSGYVLQSYNRMRSSISKLDNDKKLTAMKYTQILTKLASIYFQ
jgi:hypothetical protein